MMNEKEREVLRRSGEESKDVVAKGNETFKEEEQNNTNESRPKLIILANNIKGTLK